MLFNGNDVPFFNDLNKTNRLVRKDGKNITYMMLPLWI